VQRVLRLDAPPTPADASDALALALCHAWRTGGAPRSSTDSGSQDKLTPAQEAWRAAEKAARS
jgi:crossover junction endodeoxyribonuclease RuvC